MLTGRSRRTNPFRSDLDVAADVSPGSEPIIRLEPRDLIPDLPIDSCCERPIRTAGRSSLGRFELGEEFDQAEVGDPWRRILSVIQARARS